MPVLTLSQDVLAVLPPYEIKLPPTTGAVRESYVTSRCQIAREGATACEVDRVISDEVAAAGSPVSRTSAVGRHRCRESDVPVFRIAAPVRSRLFGVKMAYPNAALVDALTAICTSSFMTAREP